MSDEATLLPCPFCGGEAGSRWQYRLPGEYARYWVLCQECGSASAAYGLEAEAIAAWNTRAERTCRMERVEKEERILHGWLECSNCGPVYPPAANVIQEAVRYCPYCGARVER